MNISVPKLRFEDGREEEQDSGITLRDIRDAYPKCFLLNGNRAHHLDTFVLQDGITYEVKMSAPKEASTAPTGNEFIFIFIFSDFIYIYLLLSLIYYCPS